MRGRGDFLHLEGCEEQLLQVEQVNLGIGCIESLLDAKPNQSHHGMCEGNIK